MLWFLIPSVLAIDSANCFAISCENTTSANCLNVDTSAKVVGLVPCDSGCDFSSLYLPNVGFESLICEPPGPAAGYTGSICSVASDCFSYICSVPYCYGADPDDYCPNDEGCQPQYYCDRDLFICVPALNPGDSCTFDNQCPVGYGCNLGECSLYFAVEQGVEASHHLFCKSNFEFNGICDSLVVYKAGVQIFAPFNCKIGEFCDYTSSVTGQLYKTEPCACAGILQKGGGYCSNYLEWSSELIKDNYVYLTYTYSLCSGNSSHTDEPDILLLCGSITQDQRDYLFNMRGQARYWSLFTSGAIHECSVFFNLFNSTYLLSSYEGAIFTVFSSLSLSLLL